jgi:hypothetical protein
MARTKLTPARFLCGVLVLIATASITAMAQSPAAGDGRAQANSAIARLEGLPAFSISKTVPAPDFLVDAGEDQAAPNNGAPGAGKIPAKPRPPVSATVCKRWVHAEIVALAQPFMLNRMGAGMPDGLIFALKRDVIIDPSGQAMVKGYKRARPIVLRANQGDCLEIKLANVIQPYNLGGGASQIPSTTRVSLHAQGMQLVKSISDDGSYVGRNPTSLAAIGQEVTYNLYAEEEGTFLLYTMGDTSTQGGQLQQGLFGAVNVQPATGEWYRSQVTEDDLELATKGHTAINQPVIKYDALYPPDYNATHDPKDFRQACTPILKMLDVEHEVSKDGKRCVAKGTELKLFHTDLTAIITGPVHGRFAGTTGPDKEEPPCNSTSEASPNFNPLFCKNSASPDRKQPYREVTIIYHEVPIVDTVQAFPILSDSDTTVAGRDAFAINYGTGGIGAEIYANRIGVGPMGGCVDCKFEEFFLSAWSVGDPAMLVDRPANAPVSGPAFPPCTQAQIDSGDPACVGTKSSAVPPYSMTPLHKATKAFYADDPSNVYHSYMNDHVKFRILHGGTGVTHVHHQHAHQWLQSPNSDEAAYLDSQMISPGASYTLEMVYNGSGNRNKTVGDSIFHCHFYPHFAAGMWAMWRVHDVFELGTRLDKDGKPDKNARETARALPDGEIAAGTPIPALVPLPTRPMAIMPSLVFIDGGQVAYGTPATPVPEDKVAENPGYPFFIPGHAGDRAPHPPLDFAPDGKGGFLDGGLPRHLVLSGTISNEQHTAFDWSKDFEKLNARQLPELGTHVEQVAMAYFGKRCRPSFLPDGSSINPVGPSNYPECVPSTNAYFILNGLPRKNPAGNSAEKLGAQSGAPFADPAVDDRGKPVGKARTYKAAAIELDVTFNYLTSNPLGTPRQPAWHYPQERMLTLWEDVQPTLKYKPGSPGGRQPEPLFFRANSREDFIEYWHTNLVPNYYLVDDFQVRTPTDILGQHIHLVKFDVTSSDGAANGFNYEDGTFSPLEVQDAIQAINLAGGIIDLNGNKVPLGKPKQPPAEIIDCAANPTAPQCLPCSASPQVICPSWLGAQTTIQRWWADPLENDPPPGVKPVDRTMRTVFTHDHFGPSTHQQAGLYAGLLIEPDRSKWQNPETGKIFGGEGVVPPRPDGGPTSWKADILTSNVQDSYREFAVEFQDLALAYQYPTIPSPDPSVGYRHFGPGATNPGIPVNPPGPQGTPELVSTGSVPVPGTQTVNYMNEPTIWRQRGDCDFSRVFQSDCVPAPGSPAVGDPKTPLMRAYENDKVQVRFLVGAHTLTHFFTMTGPKWYFEPSWKNSGYRSSQGNGLSEHFELLFTTPPSSKLGSGRKCPDEPLEGDCVDYLYSPSNDDYGIANGMWGIFRSYDPTHPRKSLVPLPNNPLKPGAKPAYEPCPASAKVRKFNVTAVTAQKSLPGGQLVFTGAASPALTNDLAIMYVFSEDLDAQFKLKATNVEPLILRAAAGECIQVTLTNQMDPYSNVFLPANAVTLPAPFNSVNGVSIKLSPSSKAGLSPQLLSFDAATSSGVNVGYNQTDQAVPLGKSITYKWYAGNVDRDATGALKYTPIELGSANLFPADPLLQHINGMFGAIIVEPAGSTWKCDSSLDPTNLNSFQGNAPCDPSDPGYAGPPATRAAATVTEPLQKQHFREFVAMVNENLVISQSNKSAINYQTDPTYYRYGNPSGAVPQQFSPNFDNNCAISNALVSRDPLTPVFGAVVGTPTRFRLLHPSDVGTAQVFTLAGHVWQREPYVLDSKQIGNNKESQWMGSHDQFGSTDHFDLTVAKAGGKAGIAGDYLYTVFLPSQNRFGSWGVFRVAKLVNGKPSVPASPPPPDCPKDPAAKPEPQPQNVRDSLERFIRQPTVTKPEKP